MGSSKRIVFNKGSRLKDTRCATTLSKFSTNSHRLSVPILLLKSVTRWLEKKDTPALVTGFEVTEGFYNKETEIQTSIILSLKKE